ncbi:NAC domain [Sesbania bispinosa]|nr:NAC domain [Sesbania bispinosa]
MAEEEQQPPQHGGFASLPPGCRFFPSEELLLGYYLFNKNTNEAGNFNGANLITELDLYNYDPFDLPDAAGFSYGHRGRKRHWYCYTVRAVKGKRIAGSGFWLRKGKVRDVLGGARNFVMGTRTRFVFYIGNSLKNATRTPWILDEYALVDHHLVSFVLCRVYLKPHQKKSPSEIGLSSLAEESVTAMRHIGTQLDGHVGSDGVEAKACGDNSVDRKNEVSEHPLRCGGGQGDNPVVTAPCSVDPQGSQQERLSGLPNGGALFIEAIASQRDLLYIQEQDFIELNDLA